MHAHNVYHSDLKPANILFNEKGELKIGDLGMARIGVSGLLTRAGIKTFGGGTPGYTPQEVVDGVEKATELTDVFSLGVILYELVIGDALKPSQIKAEFIDGRTDLPPAAKNLIKRACRLLGRNNANSVAEFAERLRALDW